MTYLVWIPDHGETPDDARRIDAPRIERAAELVAERDNSLRDGWEWSWPVTYHVQAGPGAPVYSVAVNRETVPEFYAEKPRLV